MVTRIEGPMEGPIGPNIHQAPESAIRGTVVPRNIAPSNQPAQHSKLARVSLSKTILERILAINAIAIIGTIAISAPFQATVQQFQSGGAITYFSIVQLLILSYLAYQVLRERTVTITYRWRSPIAIWAAISMGGVFLALNDGLLMHAWLDQAVHTVRQLEDTAASEISTAGLRDRIGALTIGGYGIVAIGLLAGYRRELRRCHYVFPYAVFGFVLLFVRIGVNTLIAHDDVVFGIFSREIAASLTGGFIILSGSLKLFIQAFFVTAICLCGRQAQQITTTNLKYRDHAFVVSAAEPLQITSSL